jgi:hypothetical protein
VASAVVVLFEPLLQLLLLLGGMVGWQTIVDQSIDQ